MAVDPNVDPGPIREPDPAERLAVLLGELAKATTLAQVRAAAAKAADA